MDANTTGFMDGKPMEFPCEICGTTFYTTVGEARRADAMECPNGHPLAFDREEFDAGIRKSEERISNLMNRFTF